LVWCRAGRRRHTRRTGWRLHVQPDAGVATFERGAVLGDLDDPSQAGDIIADAVKRGRAVGLFDDRVARATQCDAGETLCDHKSGRGWGRIPFAHNGGCRGRDHSDGRCAFGFWPVQAPGDGGKDEQGEGDGSELGTIHAPYRT
jgi:hypothetical protein